MRIGDLLVEFSELQGERAAPPILTLTEKSGFIRQAERFKKRLATEDTSGYKVVRRNDIAFNPYLLWAGAVAQNDVCDLGVISPLYPTFRVREGHHPRFIGQLLLTPQMISKYDGIAFGSVPRRRRSSVEGFLSIELPPVPPLEVQQRIAAALDATDDLRAKRLQALTELDALAEAIFVDCFVTAGSQEWDSVRVAAVAANHAASIRTGPFGSQLLHSEFVDEGVAVIGIDNAVQNRFAWGERRFITEEKYSQLQRYRVFPGDVIVTIMGTCGRVAIVPDDIPLAISTKHLCCITIDRALCVPEFLWACLRFHPLVMRQLGATHGAVMPGLNMGRIKEAEIPLPPIEAQQRFAEQLHGTERVLALAGASSGVLENLYCSLQQRAFWGAL